MTTFKDTYFYAAIAHQLYYDLQSADLCLYLNTEYKQKEREGTMGCLLHLSPKFYHHVFLLVTADLNIDLKE